MTTATPGTDGKFSGKAFGQGLMVGALILASGAGWLQYQAPKTLETMQMRLASHTINIEDIPAPVLEPLPAERAPEAAMPSTAPAAAADAPPPAPVAEQPAPEPVALQTAPVAGLYEDTPEGRLPKIDAQSGQTPFQAYRRPFDAAQVAGKPVISLVLTDLGLSKAAAEAAVAALPPQISFAISPYADAPDGLIANSRTAGHEIWLVMPMQTAAYPRTDPGPHTLLKDAPKQDNLAKLTWLMARPQGYAGFLGSADPEFLKSPDAQPVLDAIYSRGIALAAGSDIQNAPGKPYIHTDLWLTGAVTREDMEGSLKALEDLAARNGHATAVLQPLPLTYEAVKAWIETLPAKGFVLAPLSAQAGG